MRKIIKYLKHWNLFEIIFTSIGVLISIILTIIFKSSIIDCLTSIATIIWCILLAKGKVSGHIVGIIATVLYVIVSLTVSYYGEVIISFTITIPMCICGLVSWLKNKRQDSKQGEVVKIKRISVKEVSLLLASQLILGFGFYFLLKAFNTEFLIVSTMSIIVNVIATYLLIRRSELNWWIWILSSIITLTLWLYLTITKDISYLTLTVMSILLFINNIYGIINWKRLKKSQLVN